MKIFLVPTFPEKLKQKSDCHTNEYKVNKGEKTKWMLIRSLTGLHVNHCGSEWIEEALQ